MYNRQAVSALLKFAGDDSNKLFAEIPALEETLNVVVLLPLVNDGVAKDNLQAYVQTIEEAIEKYMVMLHAADVWKANKRSDLSEAALESWEKVSVEISRLGGLVKKYNGLVTAYERYGVASAVEYVQANIELSVRFE